MRGRLLPLLGLLMLASASVAAQDVVNVGTPLALIGALADGGKKGLV